MGKCPNCGGYIDDRPKGDFPKDIPTVKDFEKHHTEPQGYGDEGEWLLISKRYTREEAFEKLIKVLKDDWGMDEEWLPKDPDDLGVYNIGWGYDYDSYHYSEGCWWICTPENQVTKRFEAWGVVTQ